ncbi:MAG: aconitate hydratase AcnA [Burkholderiaceae bacterium]
MDRSSVVEHFELDGERVAYISLDRMAERVPALREAPLSIRLVFENIGRQIYDGLADEAALLNAARWFDSRGAEPLEISFKPGRLLLQEASGIPMLGDMASMRDAAAEAGMEPGAVNPETPIDLVVDHTLAVDSAGSAGAASDNLRNDLLRNAERYRFLRWAESAFSNIRVFPPGSGICHQINLEFLSNVVGARREADGSVLLVPDSVVGMDSHTPMVNSLGVLGWGIGGLEGCAVALGETVSLLLPKVYAIELTGVRRPEVTATDIVLTITERLRRYALQGLFVEYIGEGLSQLGLADRATIANMTPENGATLGLFPIDEATLAYLRNTNRSEAALVRIEQYWKRQGLWASRQQSREHYAEVITVDLSEIEPSIAGPNRPHQRIALHRAAQAFMAEPAEEPVPTSAEAGALEAPLQNGDIVIAAITSCTNTANPSLIIGAALLARKARELGLMPSPRIKTSLSLGSRAVENYLRAAGLMDDLEALGFHNTGFGCMTCMGNSGSLPPEILAALAETKAVAVLSGNRNFEGRIFPQIKHNLLCSPQLVVAYALAGNVRKDLSKDPIAFTPEGQAVHLHDLWPAREMVEAFVNDFVCPTEFARAYQGGASARDHWNAIEYPAGEQWAWESDSTFIRRPPFLDGLNAAASAIRDGQAARILAIFGDMLTTDHISPIGAISENTPADRYLQSLHIERADYVNYAARRLNHDVMVRGTFANVQIVNEMLGGEKGGLSIVYPEARRMSLFDAAEEYRKRGVPLVVFAGREYGAGSSRDWAAKGTLLLGVKAVIAESFERIHRSNLVCMGVLPLQMIDGATKDSLKLVGDETIEFDGLAALDAPRAVIGCSIRYRDGAARKIRLLARLDTLSEVAYLQAGGILKYALKRKLAAAADA